MTLTGKYGFGKTDEKFPATAFVVEKALSMMNKGYASIIIQNSAGSRSSKRKQ